MVQIIILVDIMYIAEQVVLHSVKLDISNGTLHSIMQIVPLMTIKTKFVRSKWGCTVP